MRKVLVIALSLTVRWDEILRYRLWSKMRTRRKIPIIHVIFFQSQFQISAVSSEDIFNNVSYFFLLSLFHFHRRGNDPLVSRLLAKINKLVHARLRRNDASLTLYRGRDELAENTCRILRAVRAGTNFKTVTENLHVRARICSAKRM